MNSLHFGHMFPTESLSTQSVPVASLNSYAKNIWVRQALGYGTCMGSLLTLDFLTIPLQRKEKEGVNTSYTDNSIFYKLLWSM